MVGSSTYYTKRKKQSEKVQNRVGRKPHLQEAAENSRNNLQNKQKQDIKAEQQIKEKLDRPTPEMPGMHQPSTFSKKVLSKSMRIVVPIKQMYIFRALDSSDHLLAVESDRGDPTRPVVFEKILTRPDSTHEIFNSS